MNLSIGTSTDVGRARSANEDSYFRDDDGRVYAVADGMGGHRAGDVASATAVETLTAELAAGSNLVDAIVAANTAVFAKAQANPEMRGMGTTVTATQVGDEQAFIAHVGDSRAYLLRDGQLTQVTEDHSLVEELVREGRLSPEEAAIHPQRSIITRALGVDEDVEVATYQVDLRPDDRLLLCSDGLTGMLSDDAVRDLLSSTAPTQNVADALVDAANRAGGDDNITVIVIDVIGDRAKAREKAIAAGATVEPSAAEKTGEWEPVEAFGGAAGTSRAKAVGPKGKTKRGHRPLRRALLWGLPVVIVIAVALFTLRWYSRSTYYVGIERERVTLYRGVPGGFLMWDPTVEERSDVRGDDLGESTREDLTNGHRFSSLSAAQRFVRRLEQSTTTTTTSTSTTTTTTTTAVPA